MQFFYNNLFKTKAIAITVSMATLAVEHCKYFIAVDTNIHNILRIMIK